MSWWVGGRWAGVVGRWVAGWMDGVIGGWWGGRVGGSSSRVGGWVWLDGGGIRAGGPGKWGGSKVG